MAQQYIVMARNNLCIIWTSLVISLNLRGQGLVMTSGKIASISKHMFVIRKKCVSIWKIESLRFVVKNTGGPPLTQKSLTRFQLPRFLAYVHVSGGISVSRGLQYSPTNINFM